MPNRNESSLAKYGMKEQATWKSGSEVAQWIPSEAWEDFLNRAYEPWEMLAGLQVKE
jgi:hypothetical protein